MKIKNYLLTMAFLASTTACHVNVSGDSSVPPLGKEKAVGGVDGGGGKSIVCRADDGAITSAEVLDLYEARVMYGLNIQKLPDPVAQQIDTALKALPKSHEVAISAYVEIVKKNMTILPVGTEIEAVNDSLEVVLPKNCHAEQLARYYSNDRILVNGEIWNHLSETDRAALVLHEATYAVNRIAGATDSRRSRHIVASLFDVNTHWSDPKENIPADAMICTSQDGPVYLRAYQSSHDIWILDFEILGKGIVASKKWALIPSMGQYDFNEAKTFPMLRGEDKIGQYSMIGATLHSDFEGSDIISVTKRWEAVRDMNGQKIPGYQTPGYYLSWKSGSFPDMEVKDLRLNCSLQLMP